MTKSNGRYKPTISELDQEIQDYNEKIAELERQKKVINIRFITYIILFIIFSALFITTIII